MSYDPYKHHRRSIRLNGYDYAQEGTYFVTICVQGGLCLLGEVFGGQMMLSLAGEMLRRVWYDPPFKFPSVQFDAFVCMPDHIHFIIALTRCASVGASPRATQDTVVKPATKPKERPTSHGFCRRASRCAYQCHTHGWQRTYHMNDQDSSRRLARNCPYPRCVQFQRQMRKTAARWFADRC
jgi:REP element-mobilizing transposase RayT